MRRMITETDLDNKQDKLIAGDNITIKDGVISSTGGIAELPVASETVLGGIKVGENLTIDSEGVLSSVGTVGPVGPEGPQGLPGKDGKDGEQGPVGPEGQPGDRASVTGDTAIFERATGTVVVPNNNEEATDVLNTLKIDNVNYAISTLKKVSQLENDANYQSASQVEATLASKNYLTEIPIEYVTETELNDRKFLTSIPAEYVTEGELESKKYLTEVPSNYVTDLELESKGYLSAIPEEYVTDTELTGKGYINTTEVWTFELKSGGIITKNVAVKK